MSRHVDVHCLVRVHDMTNAVAGTCSIFDIARTQIAANGFRSMWKGRHVVDSVDSFDSR
jgi:hypothetical protein